MILSGNNILSSVCLTFTNVMKIIGCTMINHWSSREVEVLALCSVVQQWHQLACGSGSCRCAMKQTPESENLGSSIDKFHDVMTSSGWAEIVT